MSEVLGSAYLK
ncbi:hypothetical protein F383_34519 [Gossypium arboreum]|uniref:Uncharacterized protein n=1 Tax=Gossypium arboreum TaxID=29729 RepID=A0A0B0N8U6_GOSAR|nr:hypothetical protein F383_34519 [Gossypium arboreum]